ncbi:MAG: hypothetical protein ACO331_02815 [Prochlorothrix sp.]
MPQSAYPKVLAPEFLTHRQTSGILSVPTHPTAPRWAVTPWRAIADRPQQTPKNAPFGRIWGEVRFPRPRADWAAVQET